MSKREQSLRNEYLNTKDKKVLEKIKEVDKENREEFKKIFKEVGYISSEYGLDIQLAAFLIVQHMPKEDITFMKEYLSLMKEDIKNINPLYYAQLTDRIRIYEGKKQIYGTQFRLIEGNTYKLYDIYNRKYVNSKRNKLGLQPLEEYIKEVSKERNITSIQ